MRFSETRDDGFVGRFAYEQIVPRDSFLWTLRDLIDWDQFTDRFVKMYVGKAEQGRPPYHPVVVSKCLLLACLYNLSERSVEWSCRYTLKGWLLLDVDLTDPTPDHSTLSLFRSRRSRIGAAEEPESKEWRRERIEKQYRHIFDQALKEATRLAIEWGPIGAADSVPTTAKVNKDGDRIHRVKRPPSANPDATAVNKGEREGTETAGKVVRTRHACGGGPEADTIA
jgi:transposase